MIIASAARWCPRTVLADTSTAAAEITRRISVSSFNLGRHVATSNLSSSREIQFRRILKAT